MTSDKVETVSTHKYSSEAHPFKLNCPLNYLFSASLVCSGIARGHAGHAEHDQKFPQK